MASKSGDEIKVDEVLRPGRTGRTPGLGTGRGHDAAVSEIARLLARWLDETLRIPGTNFRIGLDPILALIPGIGDFLASGSGMIILLEAVRSGVSLAVLLRMAGNMLFNTFLDVVPIVGPVASAFFKSNSRNVRLLQRWQAGQQHAVRKSTLRLFAALAVVAMVMMGLLIGLWMFYFWLFQQYFAPVVGRLFGNPGA